MAPEVERKCSFSLFGQGCNQSLAFGEIFAFKEKVTVAYVCRFRSDKFAWFNCTLVHRVVTVSDS